MSGRAAEGAYVRNVDTLDTPSVSRVYRPRTLLYVNYILMYECIDERIDERIDGCIDECIAESTRTDMCVIC
jgi:hypothetical protein